MPAMTEGPMERSLVEHEQACLLLIEAEGQKASPDAALMSVLADSVRLGQEYAEVMSLSWVSRGTSPAVLRAAYDGAMDLLRVHGFGVNSATLDDALRQLIQAYDALRGVYSAVVQVLDGVAAAAANARAFITCELGGGKPMPRDEVPSSKLPASKFPEGQPPSEPTGFRLKADWEAYRERSFAECPDYAVDRLCRRAFYAGATFAIAAIYQTVLTPNSETIAELRAIAKECEDFGKLAQDGIV